MILSATSLLLLGAVALDALLGDPPNALHPVAYLGRGVTALLRLAPARGTLAQLGFGALLALALPLAAAGLGWAVTRLPAPLSLPLSLGLLCTAFALRGLCDAGLRVAHALETGQLPEARAGLSWLCSRDPAALDETQLATAATESLAENLSDSVVAPLFYFALFGLPGALLYRAANTLDAMVGYRGRYEWLGKASARLDDLLNLAPARLTALLLLAIGPLVTPSGALRRGLRALWRDGGRTPSPNAGRPMAAAAGLLGVRLDKAGEYQLYAEGDAATPATLRAAARLIRAAALTAVALFILITELLHG